MRLAILLFIAALTAGCVSDPTTSDISITDRAVFLPQGRISIDISPREQPPAEPHNGHAVEIEFTGGSGNDTQSLSAGDKPIVFGGRVFNAPAQLTHEFDFGFFSAAYRYRHFWGTFGIEALAGLGTASLDLTVSSPLQRANEKISNGGITGGFGLVWNFRPSTSLQSRLTLFNSGDDEGISSAQRFDAYIAQSLGRNVALRGGWTAWTVTSNRETFENSSSVKSPIKARFSGPALGLDIAF